MRRVAIFIGFLIGVNAILAQSILIRELLVNFSGNELSLGIVITVWLVAGALGSIILARALIDKIKNPESVILISLSVLSILTILIVFAARVSRAIFGIPIYEAAGPLQILYISALIVTPLPFILSFCFVLCCKMLRDNAPQKNKTGSIYISEALGAAFAGIFFTFLLIRYLDSFQIALGIALINIASLVYIAFSLKKNRYALLISFLLIVLSCSAFLGISNFLQKASYALQWQPQEVLAYLNSPYGNITVTKLDSTYNIYENGSLLFTSQDEAFNENFIHPVMLQHPDPQNILLLGSGSCGIISQILKHNPSNVTHVELDPAITKVTEEFLSSPDIVVSENKKVRIIHEDARFFIKHADDKFDIIIVNMADPTTLLLNRFYTEEFYKEAATRLKKGGVLATRITSNDSIISDELARYNASAYKTLESAFSYITLIPGERLIFIASDSPQITQDRPEILMQRFNERSIKTEFLTPYNLKDMYYPHSTEYLKQRLASQYKTAKINNDFKPICFYYDLILWGVKFHPNAVGFFNTLTKINFKHVLFLLSLYLITTLLIIKRSASYLSYIVPFTIAMAAAVSITLELIIIIAFQISYGCVYGKVALLIALFMLGISFGAYVANKSLAYFKNHVKLLSFLMLALVFYILILFTLLKAALFIAPDIMQFIFYLMITGAGSITGVAFPIATGALSKYRSEAYSVSIIWGADLLGATAGSLISTLVLIPILGIIQTLLLSMVLGAAAYLILYLSNEAR